VWELPERGLSWNEKTQSKKNLVPTCSVICGTTAVDVKQNSGLKTKCRVEKAKLARERQEKTGKKP
jgi:hypothetical protein